MNKKKIVLIGAGSAVFTQGLIADFIQSEDFASWEIALCDINEKVLNSITTLTQNMVKEKKADITITSSTNRKELLPGADVVVVTIAVGGRQAWESDVYIPRKYGIYQPVGDSVMPGGISRALRMIPAMIEIAKDVKALCPKAKFFSYSNPMTAIVTAVREQVGIDVIGLCHGIIYLENYLSQFMGCKVTDITSLCVGLNHLTFMYDLRIKGQDAFPLVNKILAQQKEQYKDGHELNAFNPTLEDKGVPVYLDNPFSWNFYENYGVIPAVLDRHVVEFFPERFPRGEYYGKTLGVDAFNFDDVIQRGEATYAKMLQTNPTDTVDDAYFQRSSGEHEQLVEMLKSIELDERKVFHINVPNNGAVKNLPTNAVLELPAVATSQGFKPLVIDDYPNELAGIINRRLAPVRLTVEAAITGNKDKVEEAMLLDGAVTDPEVARNLAEELLQAHKEHLPQFDL